nr:cyclin-dependent protein kinase inhibitor SMR6 [Ipomoea batatas]
MEFAEKHHHQMEGSLQVDQSEAKRWILAGIALRNPLKPIRVAATHGACAWENNDDQDGGSSTTPTSEGSRIPRRLTCPPPPKKRKASKRSSSSSGCCYINGGGREFFSPPDLDTVFIRRLHT